MATRITPQYITTAAQGLGCEEAVIKAVVAVESSGNGFLPDGRVIVAFEEHVFYDQLKKVGINPASVTDPKYADIVSFTKWSRDRIKSPSGEYDQLQRARQIHSAAALKSASYGMFQLMGFNHKGCGFSTVEAFYDAMCESEGQQLQAFVQGVKSNIWPGALRALKAHNWAAFAEVYNGPGYKKNQYDVALAKAYARFSRG